MERSIRPTGKWAWSGSSSKCSASTDKGIASTGSKPRDHTHPAAAEANTVEGEFWFTDLVPGTYVLTERTDLTDTNDLDGDGDPDGDGIPDSQQGLTPSTPITSDFTILSRRNSATLRAARCCRAGHSDKRSCCQIMATIRSVRSNGNRPMFTPLAVITA